MIKIKNIIYLGYQNFKSIYADSKIGILWSPIGFLILLIVKVIIFSSFFHSDRSLYIAYISIGLINWILFNLSINRFIFIFKNNTFLLNTNIKTTDLLKIYFTETLFIFLLNLIPVVIIVFYCGYYSLLFLISIIFVIFYYFELTKLVSLLGIYFNDFGHLIKSSLFCMYFLTPIFWLNNNLIESYYYLFVLNPLFLIINIQRSFLGINQFNSLDIYFFIFHFFILIILNYFVFNKSHNKIKNYIL